MDNVEIPNWIKGLPLAPVFRPTDTEFADPIAYISKIEKEASAFGICKVIPPLPKPSKKYVLNNLNKSLAKSRELDLNFSEAGNLSRRVPCGKGNDNEGKAVFTTRQQELGQAPKRSRGSGCEVQPAAQKQVWQSGEVYTLEQFETKARAFSRSVLGGVKEVTPQVIESLFWKATSEKPIYIEYANDVPGSGFGEPEGLLRYTYARKRRRRRMFPQKHQGRYSCMQQDVSAVKNISGVVEPEVPERSLYSRSEPSKECANEPTSSSNATVQPTDQGSELEGTAGWKLSNCPWNLQVIARSAGSLTRFMLDDIPGVTSPMVYIGMLFSWFAWHVEDHELHSLNFLHMGSPKTWYAVPGEYAFAFEEATRRHAYGGDIDHLAALKLLGEKTTLLSPESVIASGIPCCRLVQNPGEFVVTFPRAYHVGFSHGFNCGEAANFGTPQWLTVAKDAAVRRAVMNHLPMLSHQQLLYLLTMSYISRVPKSLLAGVRSSRLRDRLKIEKELLVKKAFIEDVLKENSLLNTLLRKDVEFRVVLWHPDSLPSFSEEFLSQSGCSLDPPTKYEGLSEIHSKNADQDGIVHGLTSYMETVNDLYLEGDDISCDFQVDSGTLPCVACGILGYPFMCVIQPSRKASMKISTAEHLTKTSEAEILQKTESYYPHYSTDSAISGDRWDTSGFPRPRIFCLEHAVKIEELLRPKGGARMLIICHSDFRKMKANAAVIAEEIGTAFNYEELLLDNASSDELNVIDLAINSDQFTDCKEDWTSILGMNLRHGVKARISCPLEKMERTLNLDYLLSVIGPSSVISSIKWCSRKSRTRRESKYRKPLNSHNSNHLKNDEIIHEPGAMERKEKGLLQYSRRKYRINSRNCDGAKLVSGCNMERSAEGTDGNCRKIATSEQETSVICVKNMEADSDELHTSNSLEKCVGLHDEDAMAGGNKKHADHIVSANFVDLPPLNSLVHVNLPLANKLPCEVMLTETPASTSDDFIFQQKTRVDEKAKQANEYQKCYSSPDNALLDMEKYRIKGNNNMRHEKDTMDEVKELVTSSPEDDGGDLRLSSISGSACHTTCVAESTDIAVSDKACLKVVHEDSSLTHERACSSLVDTGDKGKIVANVEVTSRNRSKRARESVLLTEVQSDFVRSPCEGLRPRRKEDLTHKTDLGVTMESAQQKPQPKKIKKSSGNLKSPCAELSGCNKGSYKCNLEGCRMCFKTREELSLHKNNRCHYEDCRKKFRSHKYVLLHQRVHDIERPLKCTWKGCSMTFKWAWARTEHLRLHTGERPYQCKFEGCDLTFRFVSDFSRHRRKTGHM